MRYAFFGEEHYRNQLRPLLSHHQQDDVTPEYVFSLGGDGTILRAVQKYQAVTATFVGINMGKLGFYTDFELNEFAEILRLIETKSYKEESYSLLSYKFGTQIGIGLNEIAIINPVHTHIIEVFIDDLHFETFRGTGFLISTPTGSTAYNKSCGGSIVDPKLEALQLTEVASINNRIYKTLSSPIIIANGTKLRLKSDFSKAFLSVDGIELNPEDAGIVEVCLSEQKAKFITRPHYQFWNRVKKSFLD